MDGGQEVPRWSVTTYLLEHHNCIKFIVVYGTSQKGGRTPYYPIPIGEPRQRPGELTAGDVDTTTNTGHVQEITQEFFFTFFFFLELDRSKNGELLL
ncbi:hypothetical protein GDO81_020266 [Engystomops pustulosus]|uniref:Uncharacterized protein n=1 Tax=Engystomops pustulosus TaxID=76066 RepID=A0AAV6ZQA6_ENGPU|nr:hypothetical protein GDO81_020266 [Engystomops pustulosus]